MKSTFKSGISLIAVLMFMLAATTASIVIFRWISQENFSSGARLKGSEAYQASQAGLEAVQGWLTNKGADAGALIRVFNGQNGQKQPVLLEDLTNNVDLLAGANFKSNSTKQQEFEVYLTGVDTEKQPYKFKFLSVGTARDGSRHSQVGIFDVEGLYKVNLSITGSSPKPDPPAVFLGGGNMEYGGNNRVSSAYINGDWTKNPPKTDKDFVVTGNWTLSGDGAEIGGTLCVGKNLSMQNQKIDIKDAYVDQNALYVGGGFDNLFVGGNLEVGSVQDITVRENLTVNGTITPESQAKNFTVNGNLVMGPSGVLKFTKDDDTHIFEVKDSVWIPNASGIPNAQNSLGNSNKRMLGSTANSFLAVQNLLGSGPNSYYQQDSANVPFSSNAAANNRISNLLSNFDKKPAGAEKALEYCNTIWHEEPGCNGERFVVEDIIKTADLQVLKDNAANSRCSNIDIIHNLKDHNDIQKLNTCYSTINKDYLYNGTFLIINMSADQNMGFENNNNPVLLDGNFIFIFASKTPGHFRLPPMKSTSKALIYLEDGIDNNSAIMPGTCPNGDMCPVSPNVSATTYNYFIYALKGVAQINGFKCNCPIKGTVYVPQKKLDGTPNCGNNLYVQGSAEIIQNIDLITELSEAGIICDYGPEACQQGGGSGGSSSSGGTTQTYYDPSYVPAIPHLKVTLQSQYANEEDPGTFAKAEPAILVMPRIIYEQEGKINNSNPLTNYYKVLRLNGASKQGGTVTVTGCSETNLATAGHYTCTATLAGCNGNNDLCNNNFYVVITPDISLAGSSSSEDGGISSSDGGGSSSSSEEELSSSSEEEVIRTLTCATVPSIGWAGTSITPPVVKCGNEVVTPTSWSNSPDWNSPNAGTYNNIKANYICEASTEASCSDTLTVNEPTLICTWTDANGDRFVNASNQLEGDAINVPTVTCNGATPTSVNVNNINFSSTPWNSITAQNYSVTASTGSTVCGKTSKGPVSCGAPLVVRRIPQINSCPAIAANTEGEAGSNLASAKPTVVLNDPSNVCSTNSNTPNGSWTNETWTYTSPSSGTFNWSSLPTFSTYPQIVNNFFVTGKCGTYGPNLGPFNCTGTVKVTQPSLPQCAYQSSWCNDLYANAADVPRVSPSGNGSSCFFVTAITQFCANQTATTLINGLPAEGNGHNLGCWSNNGTLTSKVDGGYYIYLPQDQGLGVFSGTAGGAPNCSGGAPCNAELSCEDQTIAVDSTPSNDKLHCSCNSAISGVSWSGLNNNVEGVYNSVVFSATCGTTSVSATCKVTVTAPSAATPVCNGSETSFGAGNHTISVSASCSGSQLLCWGNDGVTKTVTFNDQEKSGEALKNGRSDRAENWGISKPVNDATLAVSAGTVKCRTDW